MIKRWHYALMLMMLACAWQTHAVEVEPFVAYVHSSAATRGVPFNNTDEHTQEFIGAGVTLTVGEYRRFEIDVAQGVKSVDAGIRGPWVEGTEIAVRYYFGRGR